MFSYSNHIVKSATSRNVYSHRRDWTLRNKAIVSVYRPEDEAAEKRIGAEFAVAWDFAYMQLGGMSRFDGFLTDQPGNAPCVVRFIFELKNRNVRCDGTQVFPADAKSGYPTLPLSKEKVEWLYAEAIRRGVPALLVFHAKDGDTTWWIDIARCVNLKVHKNSGRTKTPLRASDIEDCVYIPVTWFTEMTQRYQPEDGYHYFGIPYERVRATQTAGEFA